MSWPKVTLKDFHVNPQQLYLKKKNLLEYFYRCEKLLQLWHSCSCSDKVLHTLFVTPLANMGLLCFKTKVVLGYPISIFFIVVNEFCERFSYYGMRGENRPSCAVFCLCLWWHHSTGGWRHEPLCLQLSWCCTSRTSWTGTKTWPPPFITPSLHFATWRRSWGLLWPTHGWENTSERLPNVSVILQFLHSFRFLFLGGLLPTADSLLFRSRKPPQNRMFCDFGQWPL